MNIEEATERVLKGDPWTPCDECSGLPDCPRCEGFGTYLEPDYERACQVIGRPLPLRPGLSKNELFLPSAVFIRNPGKSLMSYAKAVERILQGNIYRRRRNHQGIEVDPSYAAACTIVGRPQPPPRPPFPGLQVGDPIAMTDDGRVKKAGPLSASIGVVVAIETTGNVQVQLDSFGSPRPLAPALVMLNRAQVVSGKPDEDP